MNPTDNSESPSAGPAEPPHFPGPPPGLLGRIFWGPEGVRSGWRLLVFVILFIACAAVLEGLAHRFLRLPANHFSPRFLLFGEGALALCALLATAIMAVAEKRSFSVYFLPWRSILGARFWWGALWGWLGITGLLLLIRYYQGFGFGTLALRGPRTLVFAVVWAVCFFLVGFFEELFFRGYALYTLTSGIGFWPAAVLLSAAFGAVHLRNPGEDWVGSLSAACIGLFFCFTVRRTGSLWFAIGCHAMWDYGETFLYSVPDSGMIARGHLLNSYFQGPNWLTGGSVGPEGSAFVFIVIVNLFLVFHLLYPQGSHSLPAEREESKSSNFRWS